MLDFPQFDRRHYPTVPVCEGYREWVTSYERTVEDEMDLVLLAGLEQIPWAATGLADDAYDLVTTCLVDEHLQDLRPGCRPT